MQNTRRMTAALAVAGAFALLYKDVALKLVHDWATDDNYSHGFLIVPLAMFFAWEQRHRLAATPARPRAVGLAVVVSSLAVLIAGVVGAELFLTRVSIVGLLAGGVVFLFGWPHLRILAFPIAFLLLMIPIPAIIFNQIALPLQLLASRFGEQTLSALSVPVFREGNIIVLPHTTLEVAEACSGIRSLVSLITLGIVYGRLGDARAGVRLVLALGTIPIAIFANGLRVAGTGVAAQTIGPEAALGFFHTFSGWMVFIVAFAMVVMLHGVLSWGASLFRGSGIAPRLGWEAR